MKSIKGIIETVKNLFIKTFAVLKATHEKMLPHPIKYVALISVLLVFMIEALSRHSLIEALVFMFTAPHLFIYNGIIIALTLTPAFLFKKKDFMLFFLSIIWLGLGIANCCVLAFRITPLGAVDIALLDSVTDIFDRYLEPWHIVFICIGAIALIALIVYLWIKAPKRTVRYIRATAALVIMCIVTISATQLSLSASAIEDELGNLADAYDEYGFAYCFSASVVDRGIDRPDDYSAKRIDEIMNTLPEETSPEEYPDIIFVQLESFFDVEYLNTLELSADCIPNFRYVKDNYLSGFLTVPSIGAGTANTEFEVISGMRLYDFGTGEYPYKTVLQDAACETINTYLSSNGLTCHAIHNHVGNFYDRNNVYKSLGFDTFVSLEYMHGVTYNALDWANDDVLTNEILKALDSTDTQDFIYAVTVQGHGKYPEDPITDNSITISGFADPDQTVGFEYFVNQLYETDTFIGDLIAALEARDKPAVLVLFGDHLPTFNISEEDLQNNNLFQTEYAIWSNTPLMYETERKDLTSYQLYSYVLELLGSSGGIISRMHQSNATQDEITLIEYDMLYGENYALGEPVQPSDMRMGVADIVVDSVTYNEDGYIYITGKEFTPKSLIMINDDREETEYISDTCLKCKKRPDAGDVFSVGQYGSNRELLSQSNEIVYSK